MKPHIFEIKSVNGIASNLYHCFIYWLEMDVYTRKRCYDEKANPLVVKPKEVKLLRKNFDESIIPYVVIGVDISEDEVNQTKRVLEKAAGEFFGSMDGKNRKIDLIEIKNPESDEEFQNFLISEVAEVGGNPYCTDKQRKVLPEYVSLFCVNSKAVKTLSEKIVRDSREIRSLEEYMGPGD